MVQVCNHFPEFVDKTYSEKVIANTAVLEGLGFKLKGNNCYHSV